MAIHYVHSPDQTHCCPAVDQDGNNVDDKPVSELATPASPGHTGFILHYAARAANNKWKHQTVTMNHTDPRQVASWVKTIRNCLNGKLRYQHCSGIATGRYYVAREGSWHRTSAQEICFVSKAGHPEIYHSFPAPSGGSERCFPVCLDPQSPIPPPSTG
jgi:hypothetical protein